MKKDFVPIKNVSVKLAATIGFCIFLIVVVRSEYKRLQFRILNHYIPSQYADLVAWKEGQPPKLDQLHNYIRYYQAIVRLMPNRSAGYEWLGWCYYYAGKIHEAQKTFQKASELNPDFFWNYYNLGVISLKQLDYQRAVSYLDKAGTLNPQKTLFYIAESKIYRDILRSGIQASTGQELNKGIRRARELSKVARLLEKIQDEKLKAIISQLGLQLF